MLAGEKEEEEEGSHLYLLRVVKKVREEVDADADDDY